MATVAAELGFDSWASYRAEGVLAAEREACIDPPIEEPIYPPDEEDWDDDDES